MQPDAKKRFPIPAGFIAAFLFFVITIAFGGSVPSKQSPSRQLLDTQSTPQVILASCVAYAADLVPEERAFLLVRIARLAATNYYPQSTTWALQAFSVSSGLPESRNKIALQKNALVALASTQAPEALRLLGTLPVPTSTTNARIGEDVRADAARAIFEAAYRSDPQKSFSSIIEVSNYLGRTGQYPYAAWGILLPRIAKTHPDIFDQVVSTAVNFYTNGISKTRIEDDDYLSMANAIAPIADPSQMKMVVSAAVDHLETEPPPKDETYMSVVGQGAQRTGFDDRTKALLYQWLPLIKQFDSDDYDDLSKKLNVASPPQKPQQQSVEIIGNKQDITPAIQQKAQDRLEAEVVENDAASAPDTAIRESTAIRSMAMRADALAVGAMNIPTKETLQRKKLFAESRRDLDQVQTKDTSYLQALADLAQGYFHSKMPHQATSLVHDGLNEGSEILDESADAQPNAPTMLLGGYDSLATLTQIGMNLDPNYTLRIVRSLQNEPLKVNLLVDIADALAAKQSA